MKPDCYYRFRKVEGLSPNRYEQAYIRSHRIHELS